MLLCGYIAATHTAVCMFMFFILRCVIRGCAFAFFLYIFFFSSDPISYRHVEEDDQPGALDTANDDGEQV